MKKIFHFLTLFGSILILFSCKAHKDNFADKISDSKTFVLDQQYPWVEINLEKAVEISLVEYANFVIEKKYVYLESNELIGNIDELVIFKDKIYILDNSVKERIFIFDLTGKLIKIIDNQGRGPREYIGLSHISIDSLNNELLANDRLQTGIIHYTLDGDYIAKTNSFPCSQFALFGKRQINRMYFGQSFNNDVNYEIILADKDSVIRSGFPMNDFQRTIGVSRSSFAKNSQGQLLFTPIGSDTVYQFLSDSSLRVRYVIKQKKSLWSSFANEQISRENLRNLYINDSYTSFSGEIYETNKFVSLLINEGSVDNNHVLKRNYFLDKISNKLYRINPNKYIGKLETPFLVEVPPLPLTTYGDFFVGQWDVTMATQIKKATLNYENPKKIGSKDLDSLIKNYPENGNPILCFFKY